MGHKVPPLANRLGFTRNWNSRWFATRQNFGTLVNEDDRIRRYLKKGLSNAAVAQIEIERKASKVRVIIHSARPGIVIGRRGADIDRLRDELNSITSREVAIDIKEVNNPAIHPVLVAENVAFQLERQVSFRRAMKRAVQLAMTSGGKGIRIRCAGRLGGAEMSRVESYREGKIPLGTFRADIDFGFAEARTTYGAIGVKCWIYKGDSLLPKRSKGPALAEAPPRAPARQEGQVVPLPLAAAAQRQAQQQAEPPKPPPAATQ
ncbi:MAG: 30S ribosomal protein S3 [Candidatus Omnitrophica bacterium]|nr:30S ribosomal protein S3 [Candidatus Omnitrophota bacterium]